MASILVVEDDPTIRELVRLHLSSASYEVLTAVDGLQGLQFAVSHRPDVIVSDVQMPNMDGFGMLAAVRANEQTASIPVIFLTALDDRESFRKSMNLGADDFLTKPVKRADLLNAVTGRLKRAEGLRLSGVQQQVAVTRGVDSGVHLPASPGTNVTRLGGSIEATGLRAGRGLDFRDRLVQRAEEVSPPDAVAASDTENVMGTVLFVDIRNFTTVSEILSAEQTVEFLNAFFGQACEPILDQAGWIVKFLGDGLVAMFDGRTGGPNHAERALKSAVLMVLAAHRFKPWIREKFPKYGLPEFAIGIGVNTGNVSVCRMGRGATAETTVIGDTVNIASRLEGKTKELGWSIVASKASMTAAGRRFVAGRSGQLTLKGRSGAVDIIEVAGLTARPGADTKFYDLVGAAIAGNAAIITAAQKPASAPLPRAHSMTGEHAAQVPVNVEGYQLIRKLGEGGMSEVFLADNLETHEEHVLKMLPIAAPGDAIAGEMMDRFLQEFALVSQIDHPNVARIYAQGFTDHHAYISMEHFPGGDLRELIAKGIAPDVAVAILLQIAGALTACHAQGVVHRDMKPDNVMIRADGSLGLADFGIAKKLDSTFNRTKHGEVFGTPYYLAPEQALGLPVDPRTDLYSLGVVFYEMLTGRRPFQADNAQALMYQHVNAPIPRLPAGLEVYQGAVDKMMAKKPADRFDTANQLIEYITDSGLVSSE